MFCAATTIRVSIASKEVVEMETLGKAEMENVDVDGDDRDDDYDDSDDGYQCDAYDRVGHDYGYDGDGHDGENNVDGNDDDVHDNPHGHDNHDGHDYRNDMRHVANNDLRLKTVLVEG